MIAWLCWVYDAINNLAPVRLHAALAHGWGVLHLERSLGLDPELALNRWLTGHRTLGLLLSDYYNNAHSSSRSAARLAVVPARGHLPATAQHAGRDQRDRPGRLLALPDRAAAAASRQRLQRRGRRHARVRRLAHRLARHGRQPVRGAALAAHGVGGVVLAGDVVDVTQSRGSASRPWPAAPPSWARCLAILYPCITCLAVLATGNHYLFDVLAGVATTRPRRRCSCAPSKRRGARERRCGRARVIVHCSDRVPHVTNLLLSPR